MFWNVVANLAVLAGAGIIIFLVVASRNPYKNGLYSITFGLFSYAMLFDIDSCLPAGEVTFFSLIEIFDICFEPYQFEALLGQALILAGFVAFSIEASCEKYTARLRKEIERIADEIDAKKK